MQLPSLHALFTLGLHVFLSSTHRDFFATFSLSSNCSRRSRSADFKTRLQLYMCARAIATYASTAVE